MIPSRALLGLVVLTAFAAAAAAAACDKNSATPTPTPSASTSASVTAAPLPHGATACGDMGCLEFEKLEDAFATVLDDHPIIVAVGEAHAPKGATVSSSTKRFTDEVLPALSGKASDILVELMQPPTGCQKATAEVRQKQEVVTQKQAQTDQNEYVTLGTKARAVGVVPDLLRPTCDDLAAVADSGEPIAASLSLIKHLTVAKVKALVDRNRKTDADAKKIVFTYGGALHNDLAPTRELADYAFGNELSAHALGKYAEVDLFVPEFVQETDNWKKLEWYDTWKKLSPTAKVVMLRPRERTFVIFVGKSVQGSLDAGAP
ncbi:hypothetical protein BH09MYX1_BH09MYX1_18230 [soil metagenome]